MFWSLMTIGVDVDWFDLMKEGPNVLLISDPVMLILWNPDVFLLKKKRREIQMLKSP